MEGQDNTAASMDAKELLRLFTQLPAEEQQIFLRNLVASQPPSASLIINRPNEDDVTVGSSLIGSIAELGIGVLPEEVLLHIFGFLDAKSLMLTTALVCKVWSKLSRDKSLNVWRRAVTEERESGGEWRVTVCSGPVVSGGRVESGVHEEGLWKVDSPAFPINWRKLGKLCAAERGLWTFHEAPKEWAPSIIKFLTTIQSRAPAAKDDYFYVHMARHATPIWYTYDPVKHAWFWTPDKEHWMPTSTVVVSGGSWRGQSPVGDNQVLIRFLEEKKPIPHFLHINLILERPSGSTSSDDLSDMMPPDIAETFMDFFTQAGGGGQDQQPPVNCTQQ